MATPIPGTESTFTSFGSAAMFDGRVVIEGAGSNGYAGLFRADSTGLVPLLDTTNHSPDGRRFSGFSYPSVNGDNVAFRATKVDGTAGIYALIDGTLTTVADDRTIAPGWSTPLVSIGNAPTISGSRVVFGAGIRGLLDRDVDGVFAWEGGRLDLIANLDTKVPKSDQSFEWFQSNHDSVGIASQPAVDGTEIVFIGAVDRRIGIYSNENGVTRAITDSTVTVPGTSDFIGFHTSPDVSNGAVVFNGISDPFLSLSDYARHGLFKVEIGETVAIARDGDPVPNTDLVFRGFYGNESAIENDLIVFSASFGSRFPFFVNRTGIFAYLDDEIIPVVLKDDVLNGRTVEYAWFHQEGLSGNELVFLARFTDGSEGVFVATIPEPATALLIFTAVCLLVGKRASRRRIRRSPS